MQHSVVITTVTPFCVPRKQIWPYPFLIAIERKRKLTTEEAQVATLHWHPAQDMSAANYSTAQQQQQQQQHTYTPVPHLPLAPCLVPLAAFVRVYVSTAQALERAP